MCAFGVALCYCVDVDVVVVVVVVVDFAASARFVLPEPASFVCVFGSGSGSLGISCTPALRRRSCQST